MKNASDYSLSESVEPLDFGATYLTVTIASPGSYLVQIGHGKLISVKVEPSPDVKTQCGDKSDFGITDKNMTLKRFQDLAIGDRFSVVFNRTQPETRTEFVKSSDTHAESDGVVWLIPASNMVQPKPE